jgi:alanine dehydrogenase
MRMLQNSDVERVLDYAGAIASLRASYEALAVGDSGFAPRIDLLGPVPPPMRAYRWGSMSGICLRSGVVAVRIKSDVVRWDGAVEDKHCVRPGLYSGIVIVYAIQDGRPLALLQDGIIQHVRLGAAVALGASALLDGRVGVDVGVLGSGGMAWSCVAAAAAIVPIRSVRVFSPSFGLRRARHAGVRARGGQRELRSRCRRGFGPRHERDRVDVGDVRTRLGRTCGSPDVRESTGGPR